MTTSILTGSRVYGTPTDESDIDLVVLMSQGEAADLAMILGAGLSRTGEHNYPGLQFRAGKLNVIVETDRERFQVWVEGTGQLVARRPVEREAAVALFDRLRTELAESRKETA